MSISSPFLLTSSETPFWIFWIWIWIIPAKKKQTAKKKNLEISPFSGATSKILHQLRLAAVYPIIFAPVVYILSVVLKHQQLSWLSKAICKPPFLHNVSVFLQVSGKNGGGKPPPEPTTWASSFPLAGFNDGILTCHGFIRIPKKPTWVGCRRLHSLNHQGPFFIASPDPFYQPRNQSTEYALRSWRIKATDVGTRGNPGTQKKTQGGFGC